MTLDETNGLVLISDTGIDIVWRVDTGTGECHTAIRMTLFLRATKRFLSDWMEHDCSFKKSILLFQFSQKLL